MSGDALIWADTQRGLTAPEQLVLYRLAGHVHKGRADCYPSLDTLAENSGLARSTVIKAIAGLVARGLIERDGGGGRGRKTVYVLDINRPAGGRFAVGKRPSERYKPTDSGGLNRPPGGHESRNESRTEPPRARVEASRDRTGPHGAHPREGPAEEQQGQHRRQSARVARSAATEVALEMLGLRRGHPRERTWRQIFMQEAAAKGEAELQRILPIMVDASRKHPNDDEAQRAYVRAQAA